MPRPSKSDFGSSGFDSRSSSTVTRHFKNREVVFAQGEEANSLFRVEKGHVKLTASSKGNKKAAISILSAGDCFGESCLDGNDFRAFTATSIQRSTIGEVAKREIARRLRQEPAFAKLFISHLLHRINRVEGHLVDQLVNSSERRLARLLLQLSDIGNGSSSPKFPALKIDQDTLAQVVGTTRSRVSHFMNKFRKKGLIDYNGSVHVNKSLATFLAGDDR